jgi:hypothetical protein
MKPREMFEVCHARYKASRAFLGGHMAAIDLESPSEGYHWRPDRARAEEYVADFEMIAERALRRPEWRGRLKLFRVYFLRGAEYRRAITLCGVSVGTFDYWVCEVKKACGHEFARTGLFPPGNYFRLREKSRPETPEESKIETRQLHRVLANEKGGANAVPETPSRSEKTRYSVKVTTD